MKDDSMTMEDTTLVTNAETKHVDLTVLDSLVQLSSDPETQNMYMYDDELSMDATIFTINVGTAASSLLQQGPAFMVAFDTLNINMYMHGNGFAMNVKAGTMSESESISVESAGAMGGDLSRLLLLAMSLFGEAASEQSSSTKPAESNDLKSVWSWLESWTTQSAAATGTANINMHMYDNNMSMDRTVFKMNDGTDGASGSPLSTAATSDDTTSASSSNVQAPANTENMYMYSDELSTKDTTFTIAAASLLQESGTSSSGQKINMYMYKNTMKMSDTIFTMNVGSQDSLFQTSSSARARGLNVELPRLSTPRASVSICTCTIMKCK